MKKKPMNGRGIYEEVTQTAEANKLDLSPADLLMLSEMCDNVDLISNCRKTLKKEGLTALNGSGTTVLHPLLPIMKQLQGVNIQIAKNLKLFTQAEKGETADDDDLDFL